jgi:hypothetical protein
MSRQEGATADSYADGEGSVLQGDPVQRWCIDGEVQGDVIAGDGAASLR